MNERIIIDAMREAGIAVQATVENLLARITRDSPYEPAARIECANGQSVSVQYGEMLYSTEDSVELGFPSDIPPSYILKYAEDIDDPTETVYGYVPIGLAVDMINEAGGYK